MANYAEYFDKIAYKPKYFIGDRVFGYWNKTLFIGSVGNYTLVCLIEGPRITVMPDLPVIYNGVRHNILIVKHKDIKQKLKEY